MAGNRRGTYTNERLPLAAKLISDSLDFIEALLHERRVEELLAYFSHDADALRRVQVPVRVVRLAVRKVGHDHFGIELFGQDVRALLRRLEEPVTEIEGDRGRAAVETWSMIYYQRKVAERNGSKCWRTHPKMS